MDIREWRSQRSQRVLRKSFSKRDWRTEGDVPWRDMFTGVKGGKDHNGLPGLGMPLSEGGGGSGTSGGRPGWEGWWLKIVGWPTPPGNWQGLAQGLGTPHSLLAPRYIIPNP